MTTETDMAAASLEHLEPGGADVAISRNAAALETTLSKLLHAAEQRWAPIRVGSNAYLKYLAERLPGREHDAILPALETMQTEQLYLACACAEGIEPAFAAFEAEFFPSATQALLRLDRSGALADEARQLLRRRLFLGEGGRPPRIVDYLGQGDLRRWVRAAAVRIGLDLLRAAKRDDPGREDDDVLQALPDSAADPELAHFRRVYGDELKAAFGQVLSARPGRERTILRYHYVDGLNIDQIGAIYQVHRTTAFRWLEAARAAVVGEIRKRLQERLGVQRKELESIMRLLDSQLDLSMRRVLQSAEPTD